MVHDPYDLPLVEEAGLAISPGTETYLAVRETKVSFNMTVTSMSLGSNDSKLHR